MTGGVLCGIAGNKRSNLLNATADVPVVVVFGVSHSCWRGTGRTSLKRPVCPEGIFQTSFKAGHRQEASLVSVVPEPV